MQQNSVRFVMLYLSAALVWAVAAAAFAFGAGPDTVQERFPGLAAGILKSAALQAMPQDLLLDAGILTIRQSFIGELLAGTDPKLRPQVKKNLFFLLEQEATRKLIVSEAKTSDDGLSGLPDAQAIQVYLERIAQRTAVTDAEARAFYEANKEMMGGMPFDQVRESVHGFLLQQKKDAIIDAHIRNMGRRHHIRVNAEWVKAQSVPARDNPVDRARASGKPSMIEFGATGCIPCDMMQPILEKLRKKYPQKLNVVFVHVRENQILTARYGIRSIPVQAFFDKNGQEVFRHKGFYAESEVVKQLKKIGVHD